jgi:glycosyltransferase involved in cell wall biosynthesis
MRFSIIIPVYNAENYLNEAIQSVISQTMDFNQNTEIILVDDGSTDHSKEICRNYTNQYPENIKYLYQVNAGPGNARNAGLDAVSQNTEYIGFLDSDDYLSNDTLEKVETFFSKHSEVQLAVIPLYHFERIDTPHRLNYRFDQGDRVINIMEEYTGIHFHIGGCFFRAEYFTKAPKIRFQKDLHFWEDALLINTFLLEHPQYGVVSDPKYYYRKRIDEDSLVNSAWYQKSRYTGMIRNCYLSLVNESKIKYNKVLPYVQFLITYHLRLYLFPKNNNIIYEALNHAEQQEFFHEFVALIQRFDKKYIKEQDMPFYYKNYLLNLQKNGWPYKVSDKKLKNQSVTITSCKRQLLNWEIEGNFINKFYFMEPGDRLYIQNKKKVIFLPKVKLEAKRRMIWGTVVRDYENAGFVAKIPFYFYKFQFGIETANGKRFLLNEVNLKEVIK